MQILACGVFLVFNWVFLFKAFEVMSITIAISVYHLAPIIVLMIGSIVFKERLTMFAVLSIVICFIGTVLVAGVDGSLSLEKLMSSGMVWALLAALFYAFTTLLGKGIQHTSAYAMTFYKHFRYIFIATIRRLWQVSRVNRDELDDDYSDRSYTYGICILLIFDSLRDLSTRLISVLVFLDPAVAILLDTVFTGFRPTSMQIVGIVLIFVGMAFTFRKTKDEK